MAKKAKTNSAAKKRFRVVSKTRIKRAKAFKRHLLTRKSSKRKRNLGKQAYVSKADRPRIARLLA